MALVRDPYFWKRFSTAVHLDEESKGVQCNVEAPQTEKPPISWLEKERRKSKRSLIWGFVIFFCIVLLVTGGVIVWWLSKHNWLQSIEP
ncbi:hypothetical protein N7468_006239 [Penicillium chermesinum]|uniref:Uncharacterized protein n=1 Tax=Penicillium chermesinum TaxID=63820 RepID=A0A9W9NS00_9EURO|nr:uncharacterized protein N7468_006239 [Penicillium chermesinum]KAJ5225014.1 hypothetical protein N7468_006239 [Penicillium chermesinum]KAJ6151744.1 hypothetical protein N7470_006872 [Penicillium chermesinum]